MLRSKVLTRNYDRNYAKNYESCAWRSLLVLVVAITLLLIQTPNVSAAPPKAAGDGGGALPATVVDLLCVDGLVINHQEQPLGGWTVTASYVGEGGTATPQTAVSGDNGEFHFDLPVTGRWLFTLAIPSDWKAVTQSSFDVDVAYGSTECLQIRFKVEQEITITVLKIDDDHNPLEGWTIIATPGQGNTFSEVQRAVTDADGYATFLLSPGDWTFSEEAPADVTWWRPIMPPDGVQSLNVRAPGPYTIRFKNDVKITKDGCIEVTKRDLAPGTDKGGLEESFGLPGWPIQVLRVDGSLAAEGITDAFGQITFSDLPLGPYIVKEIMLPGWAAVTPTIYEVFLARGDDCQVITFQNKQTKKGFCFEGQKLDLKDNYGIPGWKIDANPVEVRGVDPEPVYTDGEGKFRIDFPLDDYRVPGSTYYVCEKARDGWASVNPTCQTVTLPNYPGDCRELPPFINRQTNEEHPQPQPTNDHQGHHGNQENHGNPGNHNQGQPENPGACTSYHTVTRGESLSSIAPRYGTNVQGLLQANPWVRAQRKLWLYVGQQVCIP